MPTHQDTVHAQFNPRAEAYLHSAVHAQGPDLDRAQALLRQALSSGEARGLDVGCGAGHLSYVLAACLSKVVALDPSPAMLATVEAHAAARGQGRVIQTVQGAAESLPFPDASFDVVASRYSAHHWTDLRSALGEMGRVLRPGGRLLMIDIEGQEDALVDTHLQAIELLRDGSHVRDRSPSEWQALLAQAGFVEVMHERWPVRLAFAPWVERMRTPPSQVAMIRALQEAAPAQVRRALAYESDGSFTAHSGLFWARKG